MEAFQQTLIRGVCTFQYVPGHMAQPPFFQVCGSNARLEAATSRADIACLTGVSMANRKYISIPWVGARVKQPVEPCKIIPRRS